MIWNMRRVVCAGLGAVLLGASLLVGGCGEDAIDRDGAAGSGTGTATGTATGTGTGTTTTSYTGTDPSTACDGRLEPRGPTGTVSTVGDGTVASCTEAALQAAVAEVNAAAGGGTVDFDCGGEVTLTLTASLYVQNAMMIDGGGTVTLSGGNAVRVIELELGPRLDFVLQRIVIRDGFVPAGADNESGAGLLHPWYGSLELIDVTFDNNHAASENHDVGGGALYAGGLNRAVISGCTFLNNSGSTGGAVLSRSTNLQVVDSVFVNNSATTEGDGQYGNGGGLYIDRMCIDETCPPEGAVDFVICGSVFEGNHAKVHGSAFFSYNLEGNGATFDRCTFKNNDMAGSIGGGTGSVYHEGVPLLLVRSTFSGNATGAHAGGIFLGGGTNAVVESCTFEDNTTPGNAGALWAGNGQVDVRSTTFANNSADYGPVIFKGDSGSVTLTNTLFANNTTANEYSALACHETFNDGGGNVQWPEVKNNGSDDLPCAAGILFADPQLEPLGDNGGDTETMALPGGSPAIDLGSGCAEFDQRGMPRAGACDSGAYEYQP